MRIQCNQIAIIGGVFLNSAFKRVLLNSYQLSIIHVQNPMEKPDAQFSIVDS